MGLDMYLHAKRYVSSFNDEDKELASVIKAERIEGMDVLGDLRYIQCEAMYWRKANQIHRWFVKNIQDGTDDCGDYNVTTEQLTELRDLCETVLNDRSKASELLPVQEGFFFGSNAYEEWYFSDVEYTKTRLTELLEAKGLERWDFYYHSSW